MSHILRSASIGVPVSLALSLLLAAAASAQVASLASPGETPPPEETAAIPDPADREEALLAYAQCMRDNGIDMADPVLDGDGRGFLGGGPGSPLDRLDRFGEDFAVARQACGAILEAARPQLDPALQQELMETELRLAQCFRENGYPEYPDPAIAGEGRMQRGGRVLAELGIDPRSEQFQTTRIACVEQLGLEDAFGRGGRPGFGSGSGGGS